MKSIKWSSIFISLCYIGAGAFLILDPAISQEFICTVMSYASFVIGGVNILIYFLRPAKESFFRNDFMVGLLILTLGGLALTYTEMFLEMVYVILAVIIMISGYIKLQDCVDTWRLGSKHGLIYFLLAIISIGAGIIVLISPFTTIEHLHYMIGGGLIYSGVSDLFSAIYLSTKMIGYNRHLKQRDEENARAQLREDLPEIIEELKEEEKPEPEDAILDDNNNTPIE